MSRAPAAAGRPPRGRWTAVLAVALLLSAAAVWWNRGGQRALDGSLDFTMIYAGARQVALGEDPYDWDATYDTFERAGGVGRPRDPRWFHSLYPPTTYLLLAPVVGWVDWPAAKSAWLLINLVATLGVAGWVWRARPPPVGPAAGLAAVALWLLAACLHTAVAFGQPSVLVLALMLPSIRLTPRRPADDPGGSAWGDAAAGLALAVAAGLKPQLVLPWVAVRLALPRPGVALQAVGWLALMGMATLAWGRFYAPEWWTHWQAQLTSFQSTGLADPAVSNRYTHQMIHLEPWLRRLLPGDGGVAPRLVQLGRLLPPAALVATVIYVRQRTRSVAHGLHETSETIGGSTRAGLGSAAWGGVASLTLVVSLMVVYHRGYDAVLLVVPAVWLWRQWLEPSAAGNGPETLPTTGPGDPPRADRWARLGAAVGLGGVGAFLLPGPIALEKLGRWWWSGHPAASDPTAAGAAAAESWSLWAWRLLAVGHQQWLLAVVCVSIAWLTLRRAGLGRRGHQGYGEANSIEAGGL